MTGSTVVTGADTIFARGGRDVVNGGDGVDTIYGGDGFDTIHSTARDDVIHDSDDEYDGYELLVIDPPPQAARAPAARDDEARAPASTTVVVHVLDNDSDPDGDLDPSTLSMTEPPALGTAEVFTAAGGWAGDQLHTRRGQRHRHVRLPDL